MKPQAPTKAAAAQGVPVTKLTKAAREKAVALMLNYKNQSEGRAALLESIAAQLSNYDKKIKETEADLRQIGETFKNSFDDKNRLDLDHGYLSISSTTVVKPGRKFDLAEFAAEKPDMITIDLKTAPIKAAFLDKAQRKELVALGIDVTTEKSIKVKLHDKK